MILDTNALSALFAGDSGIEELLSVRERHHVPVVVVGEYLFGLAASNAGRRLRGMLDQLLAGSDILEVDLQTAQHYALVRSALQRRGRPIPENDVWIAALCIQHRTALASRDAHFDFVAGLKRVTW